MNFVICHTKRAGGNVVAEFLSHQKNLHCHGSIFPANGVVTLKDPQTLDNIEINFDKLMETRTWPAAVRKLKEAQNLTNLFLKENSRYENIPGILKILGKTDSKPKIGFKLSSDDYEKLPHASKVKLFKILSKDRYKVIFLDRKNTFEQYVSIQLCERYNRYVRKSADLPKLQKIGIKPAEYLQFKSRENSIKDKFIQDFIKFDIEFKEYFYEDLKDEEYSNDTYRSMFEYLGEVPADYIDAVGLLTHKKVNIYPPNISVTNYANVSHYLTVRNDPNFV
jgi:hypothetical protein